MRKIFLVLWGLCFAGHLVAADVRVSQAYPAWSLSPLLGVIRNDIERRGPDGVTRSVADTAIQYGLFVAYRRGSWTITDFGFYTGVQDADIWGNLLFVNWDSGAGDVLSGIIGAGHVYHRIETQRGNIIVHVPMIKTGPRWRPVRSITLHPYIGYAWEHVMSPQDDRTDALPLFGVTAGWRSRNTMLGLQYYYQWGTSRGQKDYQNVRLRIMQQLSDRWGCVMRFDVMEHAGSNDRSFMAGPVLSF